jgi:hypothetical protein
MYNGVELKEGSPIMALLIKLMREAMFNANHMVLVPHKMSHPISQLVVMTIYKANCAKLPNITKPVGAVRIVCTVCLLERRKKNPIRQSFGQTPLEFQRLARLYARLKPGQR